MGKARQYGSQAARKGRCKSQSIRLLSLCPPRRPAGTEVHVRVGTDYLDVNGHKEHKDEPLVFSLTVMMLHLLSLFLFVAF